MTGNQRRECDRVTAYDNGLRTSPENKERLERSYRKWAETQPCYGREKDYWYAQDRCPVQKIYSDASGASLICEDDEGRFEAWTVSRLY